MRPQIPLAILGLLLSVSGSAYQISNDLIALEFDSNCHLQLVESNSSQFVVDYDWNIVGGDQVSQVNWSWLKSSPPVECFVSQNQSNFIILNFTHLDFDFSIQIGVEPQALFSSWNVSDIQVKRSLTLFDFTLDFLIQLDSAVVEQFSLFRPFGFGAVNPVKPKEKTVYQYPSTASTMYFTKSLPFISNPLSFIPNPLSFIPNYPSSPSSQPSLSPGNSMLFFPKATDRYTWEPTTQQEVLKPIPSRSRKPTALT